MKKINIKVIPRAKQNKIIEENDRLKIYLTAPAQDNKANEELIELLADNFKIKKRFVHIISGHKSRNKIVSLD